MSLTGEEVASIKTLMRRIVQLKLSHPEIGLSFLTEFEVYDNGGGLRHVTSPVAASAYLGIGVILPPNSRVGEHAVIENTATCGDLAGASKTEKLLKEVGLGFGSLTLHENASIRGSVLCVGKHLIVEANARIENTTIKLAYTSSEILSGESLQWIWLASGSSVTNTRIIGVRNIHLAGDAVVSNVSLDMKKLGWRDRPAALRLGGKASFSNIAPSTVFGENGWVLFPAWTDMEDIPKATLIIRPKTDIDLKGEALCKSSVKAKFVVRPDEFVGSINELRKLCR